MRLIKIKLAITQTIYILITIEATTAENKRLKIIIMKNEIPEGTTHTIGSTHFKKTGETALGNTIACKWIKSSKRWSKPQEYIGAKW